MQQWEYTVEDPFQMTPSQKRLWEYLNGKGREGWELVQAPEYYRGLYVFKRPLPKPSKPPGPLDKGEL